MKCKKVHLVPTRGDYIEVRRSKVKELTQHYNIQGPIAFIHVSLLDNRSEFLSPICIKVSKEEGNYVIDVSQAVAIANTIAYISELLDPISIFLGLSRKNLLSQSLRF